MIMTMILIILCFSFVHINAHSRLFILTLLPVILNFISLFVDISSFFVRFAGKKIFHKRKS